MQYIESKGIKFLKSYDNMREIMLNMMWSITHGTGIVCAEIVYIDHSNIRFFLRRNDQVRLAHNHGVIL